MASVVRFRDLSFDLKALVVFGWVLLFINVLFFFVGFVQGYFGL